jgi:hypothetical protein
MGADHDKQAGFDHKLIKGLQAAATGANTHFVYQLATGRRTERGIVHGHPHAEEVLARAPGMDVTKPQYLTTFVDWAQQKFPSRYTALILKDHGLGWRDTPGNESARLRLHSHAMFYDGSDGRRMSTADLRTAIERTRSGHVDIYGFDACYMSAVEVAYELRGVASFMVASEKGVTTAGWPYKSILDRLRSGPSVGPRDLAREMVRLGGDAFGLAAVELAWMEALAKALNDLGEKLSAHVAGVAGLIESNQLPPLDLDSIDLPELLAPLADLGPDVKTVAKRAQDCLLAALAAYQGVEGQLFNVISIFFPQRLGSSYLASYGASAFAQQDTRWATFLSGLNAYLLSNPPGATIPARAEASPHSPSEPPLHPA